jgi:tRNA threonylcarbamoyladenosine biosynthesis protein TsaE
MERTEYISESPSDTWDIGERIGKDAKAGERYALYGDLGAGKTQLVKGFARGLGVRDWQYVVSPSFTIMNLYEGRHTLCHVDLYRIAGGEAGEIGMEEFLDEGVVVVEWAERTDWPADTINVTIESTGESVRKITVIRP